MNFSEEIFKVLSSWSLGEYSGEVFCVFACFPYCFVGIYFLRQLETEY